jgi:hypothetical protein
VPGSIVEKSELKTLLAEAEREAERKGLGIGRLASGGQVQRRSANRDLKACPRNMEKP